MLYVPVKLQHTLELLYMGSNLYQTTIKYLFPLSHRKLSKETTVDNTFHQIRNIPMLNDN